MELPECLSVTLTQNQKVRLVPFLGTWIMYSLLYLPLLGYPPATLSAAFFKILPIFCLCAYIFTEKNEVHELFRPESWLQLRRRDQNLVVGLLCSAVGDLCLVWRELLFVPGLLAFAAAHAFYMQGMAAEEGNSRTKSLFILLGVDVFLFIQAGIDSYILTVLVGVYVALIFTVGWRAAARYEAEGSKAALAGSVGTLLFILSDLLIAIDKWLLTIPMSSLFIMCTYYTAQLGIAMSVTDGLK